MKAINHLQAANIYAGNWEDRMYKQLNKCLGGSSRGCNRYNRIRDRHCGLEEPC